MIEKKKKRYYYNLQLFAKDGPGGEKTEPATAKKLENARKEGQVAKSKELGNAVALLALFVVLKIFIGSIFIKFFSSLICLSQEIQIGTLQFSYCITLSWILY